MTTTQIKDFGIIQHGDLTLKLTQDPYIIIIPGTDNDRYYEAHALDAIGNDYRITWDLIRDADDEPDCCDWDLYTVYKL